MGTRKEVSEPLLKSSQFRRERRQSWRDLERLLAQAEKKGLRSLTTSELTRLPMLYRGAISSLSVARAISLDKALLEYLTNLTSRAYVLVYASKRRPGEAVRDFLSRGFPSTILRYGGFVTASIGVMGLGVLSGYVMTTVDPERFYSLVPEGLAAGRNPAADTETLRETLYDEGESPIDALNTFAAFLFTHNSRVAIMSFALGFVGGAPSVALMFYNGLILGAMAAVFASRGLGSEFWAWVMPHGVPELFAICLCGAAGMVFGFATLFPGERTRLENVALRGRDMGQIVLGAVMLLFLAALLEGFFRQLVNSEPVRWLVAGTMLLLLSLYVVGLGRGQRHEVR